MKIYKSKFMKVLNFIKNEGKFERGDMVRVLRLKGILEKEGSNFYKKYENQLGLIVSIDYTKKDYIFGVKFEDGNTFDFEEADLELIPPENPIRYKKLNIEI